MTTHFLRDILRQPEESRRTIEHLTEPTGAGRGALEAATAAIRGARHVYLTGIGSSWHAALNVGAMFHEHAHPVYLIDADELLRFAAFPKDSAMIVISRSGKSTEIVQLAAKARKASVTVIGITNAPESPLAKEAHTAIVVPVAFDHAISVNTYTTLALAAGMLAHAVVAEANNNSSGAEARLVGQTSMSELKLRPPNDPDTASLQGPAFGRQAEARLVGQTSMSELKLRPPNDPDTGSLQGPAFGRQAEAPLEEQNVKSELKLRPPNAAAAELELKLQPEGLETKQGAQARVPVLLGPAKLAVSLAQAIAETGRAIPGWQEQIEKSEWLRPRSTTYFLARGSSLGSAYEARLIWEEGVKAPATAMGTGGFRHGPQEIVAKDMRFGIWIDGARMREQDLAVARDLGKLGAKVMLIGQNLPEDAGDLVFQLPSIPSEWQFLIDIIPAQLVAERLSHLSGVDSDTFRLASYVVADEGGLFPKETGKN